ncbi:MAG: ABC transporter ATP-binding protein, partial [Myxococcota bacterium]
MTLHPSSATEPQSSRDVMVRLRGVKKRYDDFWAVKGLDLEIPRGELFGFLGPNGAGKTTTMMILAGLLQPTEGRAEIAGFNVVTQTVEAKRRLGYIPDRPYVYEKLTGNEFVSVLSDMYGVPIDEAKSNGAQWLQVLGLGEKRRELVEGYSHGMRQRLVLAATLTVDPEVLIIDEPMVGLDPQAARLFKRLMRERCTAGRTVIMSTHTMPVAEETCDRVGIMHRGRLLAEGTLEELRGSLSDEGATLEEVFFALTERESD